MILNRIVPQGRKEVELVRRAVQEKFPKENFQVNREMRNEISVYESILSTFLAKMASKYKENSVKFWILGFRF